MHSGKRSRVLFISKHDQLSHVIRHLPWSQRICVEICLDLLLSCRYSRARSHCQANKSLRQETKLLKDHYTNTTTKVSTKPKYHVSTEHHCVHHLAEPRMCCSGICSCITFLS